ncbi:MAG: hypothetical protein RIR11_4763 [Bacteroidota bacterium]|jgi:GH35 family endo-1,4-beta-xylanase
MRLTLFYFILTLFMGKLHAQTYQTTLINKLNTENGLPNTPVSLLPSTESGTFAISSNYGGATTNLTVTDQIFKDIQRRTVAQGADPWTAGHIYPAQTSIATADRCLAVIWLRSATPNAKVNIFVEHSTTYNKEVIATVNLSSEWKIYMLPFQSTAAYSVGQLNFGLHLAWLSQTVEIGGAALLNYKNTVFYSQLPVALNNDSYPGIEPDAPWRAEAAASIDQLRKANLNLTVLNAAGQPIPNAEVKVEMEQHDFKFGTAVVSNRFNGGSAQNNIYQQKLTDLDGLGHGFNEVVFENDLKWPAWEEHWFSSQAAIASDIQWCADRGITVRGHNLVWPGWAYSPADIAANPTNTTLLKTRIRNHLNTILSYPGVGTAVNDWDVINEFTTNNDYANALAGKPGYVTGRELYAEIYKQADSLAPNQKLYTNDFIAIEQGDLPNNGIATWKARINEILAAGAPIEGIGFQGHFSTSPTGIPRVKEIYDDFWNTYGLEAKITEYDINILASQTVQASYMRDILTITFAHPSMKGFLMWGFWDGAHWLGNAPIYNTDWSVKPSGTAFIDQVFNKWWTNTTLTTAQDGKASVRGFKGKYKVKVTCPNGTTVTQNLNLDTDVQQTITVDCTVGSNEITGLAEIKVAPSPAKENLMVTWSLNNTGHQNLVAQLLDNSGRVVREKTADITAQNLTFQVHDLPVGTYTLRLLANHEQWAKQVVVTH